MLMIPYWVIFAYFAAAVSLPWKTRPEHVNYHPFLSLGGILVALLIGLRFKVGADWSAYEFMFHYAAMRDFRTVLQVGDPGYQALNWVVRQIGYDIWLVNLICSSIFSWGLIRFCRSQPDPWLSALIAIPYLVIVVAMGYTRQAVALGIMMAGLAGFIRNGSALKMAVWIAIAAVFHKTAVIAFPIIALSSTRNRVVNLLVATASFIVLYDYFLGDAMDRFVENYIRTAYSSQGAGIRVGMNLLASIIFFLTANRLGFSTTLERKLWRNFSVAAVGLAVLLFVLPSSTAVDRMSLYVIPLQLAILGRVPRVMQSHFMGNLVVISYLSLVQFVWLNFAQHAKFWIPYRFFPI